MAIARSRGKGKQLDEDNNSDNSLLFKRRRFKKGNIDQYIVRSKQSPLQIIVQLGVSVLLWIHMLVIVYLFISACFDHNDKYIGVLKSYFKVTNSDIREFIMILFIIFVGCFFILFIWRMYNKKRFGSLNRRKEPNKTSVEDMLNLDLVKPDVYEILQREKIIVFDKNPIKDL